MADPVYVVETIGNIVILVWRKQPVMEGALALKNAFAAVAAKHKKIGFVTVIEDDSIKDSPDAEIRKYIAALLKDYSKQMAAAVIICETTGFKAAMIRMLISAIYMMSGEKFPNQVSDSLSVGVRWFATAMGDEFNISVDRLEDIVRGARGAGRNRPAA